MSSSPRMIVYIVFTRILEKIHVESFEIQNEIMEMVPTKGNIERKKLIWDENFDSKF